MSLKLNTTSTPEGITLHVASLACLGASGWAVLDYAVSTFPQTGYVLVGGAVLLAHASMRIATDAGNKWAARMGWALVVAAITAADGYSIQQFKADTSYQSSLTQWEADKQSAITEQAKANAPLRKQLDSLDASLAEIGATMKLTSARKQPELYRQLMDKQAELQGSAKELTAKLVPVLPEKPLRGIAGAVSMQSFLFPSLALFLLMAANHFKRRGHATGHATKTADTLPDALPNKPPETGMAKTLKPSCDAADTLPDTEDTEGETYRYPTPYETAIAGIRSRSVPATEAGNVTRQAVQGYANCTKQEARDAMEYSAMNGLLIRTGEGANTRYTYPDKPTLRVIK